MAIPIKHPPPLPSSRKPFTEAQQKLIVDRISREILADPPMLELPISMNLPVMTDKGFKTVGVMTGQEFIMRSARFGARDGLIIAAQPADAQEWLYAEFNQKKLAEHFAGPTRRICLMLGATTVEDLDTAMWNFVEEQEREELAAVEAAALLERERNKDNDLWGMF